MITLEDVAARCLPMLGEAELRAELQHKIDNTEGGQTAWAREHGISHGYLHDVLNGRRAISDGFAELMGHARMVVYVRTKPRDDEDAWLSPVPEMDDEDEQP